VPKTKTTTRKEQLAEPSLSLFLQHRAHELKVGGECFVVMVAHPHEFVCPPAPLLSKTQNTQNHASILTQAL
jgi:hypothetical protein